MSDSQAQPSQAKEPASIQLLRRMLHPDMMERAMLSILDGSVQTFHIAEVARAMERTMETNRQIFGAQVFTDIMISQVEMQRSIQDHLSEKKLRKDLTPEDLAKYAKASKEVDDMIANMYTRINDGLGDTGDNAA